nr:DMT family transporter [Leucobacter viscericola]
MNRATSKFPVWAALVGSGLAGVLVALQSRVNGGLSQELGNGYVTAATSFGSGLIIMCIMVTASPKARRGLGKLRGDLKTRKLPVWTLLGGVPDPCLFLRRVWSLRSPASRCSPWELWRGRCLVV